jgi:ParB/RepB/Spo0J family partition protein
MTSELPEEMIAENFCIKIELLEPNAWNPNVMQKEEYEALKQDMHVHGVNGIDPLLVSPKQVFYGPPERAGKVCIIIDGEHRWKAAKELGWKEIRCDIESISEEDAKALCYRRNRERGTIDPFKEALLFKSELEQHMTQAQIAGKYGIEQGTVSHRLSLLKLDPQIIVEVQDMPRGIITPSHLEPLAGLETKDQKDLAETLIRESKRQNAPIFSAHRMQEEAGRIKEQRKNEKELAEASEIAKFPKCPTCGKPPTRISYKGLPWVNCENYHSSGAWNLKTGKREYEPESHEEKTLTGETRKVESSVLRSAHTVKELKELFIRHAKEVVPKVEIRNVKVSGKLDGSAFSFELDDYGATLHVSISQAGIYHYFSAEGHKYRTGEITCIHTSSPGAVEEVREFIDNAFQGKLVAKSKRFKKTKGTVLDEEPQEIVTPQEA